MENTTNEGVQKKKNKASVISIIVIVLVVALIIVYFAFLKDLLNKTYDQRF
mgnify:FL=1